jgi:hypothetical protein
MRSVLLGLAWSFIVGTAAYDSYFAWQFRDEFLSWELNPLAGWLARTFGFHAVLAFKAAWLALALSLALYCHRHHQGLTKKLTLVIAAAYLLLALYYVVGQRRSEECYGVPPERLAAAPVSAFVPAFTATRTP